MLTEIAVPDIGDFKDVEIIEILVKPGDVIKKNDPVVTLESDKSSVEVPSPLEGKVSVAKIFRRVVFPEPFTPNKAVLEPDSRSNVHSDNMFLPP